MIGFNFNKKISDRESKALSIVDPEFVDMISPATNISFAHEKFISNGKGYEACLFIYKYKKDVQSHWINLLANIDETVTVIDIASLDSEAVKANLRRSIEEQSTRVSGSKTSSEYIDASAVQSELEALYAEISAYGRIMKNVITRIYVPGRTMEDLDKRLAEIITGLEGSGYGAGVCLNEGKTDFRNMFLSYSMQQENMYRKKGQAMLSTTLALGNPFHFTQLADPSGAYYGTTKTGGSVLLDIFHKDQQRMSYNTVIVGLMGSGKSSLLKKMVLDRSIRNDMIRIFDVSGEYSTLINYLGGRIIYLDGAGDKSIINALQILPTDEDDKISYNVHLSRLVTMYNYINPDIDTSEKLVFKKLARQLYVECGIISKDTGEFARPLAELKPEDFPIWSDFLKFLKDLIRRGDFGEVLSNSIQQDEKVRETHKRYIDNIELAVEDLCSTYGSIFNGHTSIDNFYDEQLVCFNIKNLVQMESGVCDAQIFNALTLCYNNCVLSGSIQKKLYDEGKIEISEAKKYLVIVDEAHRIINAHKLTGVEQIARFEREMRKFFGGIILASQSIRDFVPDDADALSIAEIKKLFELSTYKWIFRQDSNCKQKLADIFQNQFTESEVDRVGTLGQGECILSTGQDNIEFDIELSDFELSIFAGGA